MSTGYLVGSMSIMFPDTCDTLVFSVSGADAGSFQVSGCNLEFFPGIELDADDKDTYNITLEVTDYFGQSTSLPVSIMLNNINEAPVLTNNTFGIAEDLAVEM